MRVLDPILTEHAEDGAPDDLADAPSRPPVAFAPSAAQNDAAVSPQPEHRTGDMCTLDGGGALLRPAGADREYRGRCRDQERA